MTTKVFVPRDAASLSIGAEAVAVAIATEATRRSVPIQLVRNGTRGLQWLEPLVEVATPAGRRAYGPVTAREVASLFDADFITGGSHPLSLGLTEEIALLKNQQRLTFARVGIVDPTSIEDYLAHDGYAGLRRALTMDPAAIVQAVTDSGLRGRGGAAFPTGIKWKTVLDQPPQQVRRKLAHVIGHRRAQRQDRKSANARIGHAFFELFA